ncbi:hypothetical protein HMPREF1395_00422 [Helicobacter pylori GAM112Ai]|nr:hypothetical protein HMPREF1395_00422 [Helicobacter pylori GAM112Ai]EMH35041.1 hypothetical protein HMPREF1424_00153 [Helicobacter pylori GAM42Ai]
MKGLKIFILSFLYKLIFKVKGYFKNYSPTNLQLNPPNPQKVA